MKSKPQWFDDCEENKVVKSPTRPSSPIFKSRVQTTYRKRLEEGHPDLTFETEQGPHYLVPFSTRLANGKWKRSKCSYCRKNTYYYAALAAIKKTCAKYFFQKRIKKYLTKLIHIFIIFTVKGEIFLRGNLT